MRTEALVKCGLNKSDSASVDRYLKVVERARRLYRKNGVIPLFRGKRPCPYTRCEELAWSKYMSSVDTCAGSSPALGGF